MIEELKKKNEELKKIINDLVENDASIIANEDSIDPKLKLVDSRGTIALQGIKKVIEILEVLND